MSEISTVGVVGLGTMGAGIAEVFARAGLSVVGIEPNSEALDRGRGHLERSTGRAVARGKLSQPDCDAILGRIASRPRWRSMTRCDLVIEAIPERLEWKRELFTQLDAVCPPHAILATNTSSLSVTDIAATTRRPGRVIGMHFFNPAPVMRLVEVVRTVVDRAGRGRVCHRRWPVGSARRQSASATGRDSSPTRCSSATWPMPSRSSTPATPAGTTWTPR